MVLPPPETPEPEAAPAAPDAAPEVDDSVWFAARAVVYDNFVRSQPRDDAWAKQLEARVRKLHDGPRYREMHIVGLECRSTACRMEFVYDSPEARDDHLRMFPSELTELPTAWYAYPGEPATHTRSVLYMTKAGVSMPDYPPAAGRTDVSAP